MQYKITAVGHLILCVIITHNYTAIYHQTVSGQAAALLHDCGFMFSKTPSNGGTHIGTLYGATYFPIYNVHQNIACEQFYAFIMNLDALHYDCVSVFWSGKTFCWPIFIKFNQFENIRVPTLQLQNYKIFISQHCSKTKFTSFFQPILWSRPNIFTNSYYSIGLLWCWKHIQPLSGAPWPGRGIKRHWWGGCEVCQCWVCSNRIFFWYCYLFPTFNKIPNLPDRFSNCCMSGKPKWNSQLFSPNFQPVRTLGFACQ